MDQVHTLNQLRISPRTVTVSSPAAGANFSYSFESRQWNLVSSISFRLVTDATAVNRQVILVFVSGSNIPVFIPAPGVQTASETVDYSFFIGAGSGYDASDNNVMSAPLPLRNLFEGPESVTSSINNIAAGDQLSRIIIRTEVWHDPVYPL